jgi:predicted site-specific integrase-resolvase
MILAHRIGLVPTRDQEIALRRACGVARFAYNSAASEIRDDLVGDMIDVLPSFCARLDGRRSAKRHAQRAVAALESK